jgi:hypothetical protein
MTTTPGINHQLIPGQGTLQAPPQHSMTQTRIRPAGRGALQRLKPAGTSSEKRQNQQLQGLHG